MSESYKAVVGGKLKLKRPGSSSSASSGAGAAAASSSSVPSRGAAAQMMGDKLAGTKRKIPESGADSSAAAAAAVVALTDTQIETIKAHPDGRTPAQRAHDDAMKKRQKELAGKMASKSHREKINDMNEYLSKLPQHNDIFKISYAGTG